MRIFLKTIRKFDFDVFFHSSNNNNNNNNNNYNSNEMSMTMVTNTNTNMVIPAVGREFDGDKNQETLYQTCAMLLMCRLADSSNSLVETKFNQFLMLEILMEIPEEMRRNENLWTKLVKTKGFCDFLRRQNHKCESLVSSKR